MVSKEISTKEDALRIYDECMNFLKENFPQYYNIVKEYKFTFSSRKNAYGVCNYRKKTISICMYLSAHVENWKIKDTMLHEMAHAIDKGINGYSSGHGYNWKRICVQIGCEPTSSSREGADQIKKSKYVLVYVKPDGSYEYLKPVHRITKKSPINEFQKGCYIRGRRETLNRLMNITFEEFVDKYEESENV